MEKTAVIEKLMRFNLSRQEAQLYVCLWEHGQLTGYEASKLTGISRSNVYGALSVLTDKGAAVVTEANTTLYSAVEPEEFLSNRLRRLESDKQYLVEHLPRVSSNPEGYMTIQGGNNIKDKAYNMIAGCEKRLYLAAAGSIVEDFRHVLGEAGKRGIKVVIISDGDYSTLATRFYQDEPEQGQLRLITDSAYVLTGELTGKTTDTCLYSGQENLVTVMKEALRNKIKLLEIEGIKKENDND